jgi:hypothetical protein
MQSGHWALPAGLGHQKARPGLDGPKSPRATRGPAGLLRSLLAVAERSGVRRRAPPISVRVSYPLHSLGVRFRRCRLCHPFAFSFFGAGLDWTGSAGGPGGRVRHHDPYRLLASAAGGAIGHHNKRQRIVLMRKSTGKRRGTTFLNFLFIGEDMVEL